jgi:hypothetical protein
VIHLGAEQTKMAASANKKNQRSLLHFARFEFKYILTKKQRDEVEAHLVNFLEYDPFVASRPDHKYTVRSLYYDDPFYSAFHDKIDGLHTRSKFRLRTYSKDISELAPFFLEIKGRNNNLVFKHRTPVDIGNGNWPFLRGDAFTTGILNNGAPSEVLKQFEYAVLKNRVQPVALIDYHRRPYISKYDSTFRLTFDEQITAFNSDNIFPEIRHQCRDVLSGYTVLEVKFHHHLPSWFHRVIQAHQLKRVSISKICSGMEVLGLAFDEN